MGEPTRQAYLGRYSDTLVESARALGKLATAASAASRLDEADDLLRRADRLAAAAVGMGDIGHNSLHNKLFLLADIQSRRGHGTEAAATYERILSSDGDQFPRTWIAHLALLARVPKDSPEYRAGAERILAEMPADEYEPVIRQALAFSYQRAQIYEKAIEAIAPNIGKSPEDGVNATNLILMATCYMAPHQNEVAAELLNEVLRAYPASGQAPEARMWLREIEVRQRAELADFDDAALGGANTDSRVPSRGVEDGNLSQKSRASEPLAARGAQEGSSAPDLGSGRSGTPSPRGPFSWLAIAVASLAVAGALLLIRLRGSAAPR